jgi:hypothetical protein
MTASSSVSELTPIAMGVFFALSVVENTDGGGAFAELLVKVF